MPLDYQTAFVITEKPFDWWFAIAGLLGGVAGVVCITLGRRLHWRRWQVGYFFIGFAMLWFFAVSYPMYVHFRELRSAYTSGRYLTVVGPIEDFRPMPYQGHQDECFRVSRAEFCYSDYEAMPGFNSSASHGGPIRAGLPVRVAYIGNVILRLDIARR